MNNINRLIKSYPENFVFLGLGKVSTFFLQNYCESEIELVHIAAILSKEAVEHLRDNERFVDVLLDIPWFPIVKMEGNYDTTALLKLLDDKVSAVREDFSQEYMLLVEELISEEISTHTPPGDCENYQSHIRPMHDTIEELFYDKLFDVKELTKGLTDITVKYHYTSNTLYIHKRGLRMAVAYSIADDSYSLKSTTWAKVTDIGKSADFGIKAVDYLKSINAFSKTGPITKGA